MQVTDPASQDVHMLELMTESGAKTGIAVRLRVKLKPQKREVRKTPESPRAASPPPKKKQEQRKPDENRIDQMFKAHAETKQKIEQKRQQEQAEYEAKMQAEAAALRNQSIRNDPSLDPVAA